MVSAYHPCPLARILLALGLAAALATPAFAQRPPTPGEGAALRSAYTAFVQRPGSPAARDNRIVRLAVSSITARYAAAELDSPTVGRSTLVLRLTGATWRVVGFGSSLSCAVAPRNVLSDLGIPCAPPQVSLADCGTLVQQPAALTLSCKGAKYRLVRLAWRSWGGSMSTATGTALVKGRTFPVTVTAAFASACNGVHRYLRLTIRYVRAHPKGIGNVDVHAFTCTG